MEAEYLQGLLKSPYQVYLAPKTIEREDWLSVDRKIYETAGTLPMEIQSVLSERKLQHDNKFHCLAVAKSSLQIPG